MKNSIICILGFLISGCVIQGNRLIHSPTATDVLFTWSRYRHHKKAIWNLSTDMIRLKASSVDSTFLEIGAYFLEEKNISTGILFPILPIPFTKKWDYYENRPDSLFLAFDIYSNRKIEINVDSILLLVEGIQYTPEKATYNRKDDKGFQY